MIISSDNRVFAEFTYVDEAGGVDSHSIFRRRRFPKVRELKGWYATLCYPSSSAYYHWMIESLPRLRLLEPHLDALDGLFVPPELTTSMLDALSMLGVRRDQLIITDMGSQFAPEHLLVPAYCAGLDIPDWVPLYLRNKVLPEEPRSAQRRIYLSRGKVGRRRVTNEETVISVLKKYEFEIAHPQELSFLEQAQLFASASLVVGATGAALANSVFCSAGATLVTLQPHAGMGPHVFFSLASAAGLHYWDVVGQPRLQPGEALSDHVDFEVDPITLEQTISSIIDGAVPRINNPV